MMSDISIAGDPTAYPRLASPATAYPHLAATPRPTLAQLARRASAIAADQRSWRPLVRYDAGERWYTRLAVAEDHEVWLLSWLPGQGTGLHDHGGSSGVVAVAAGELVEYSLTRRQLDAGAGGAQRLIRRRLDPSQSRVFGPHYAHDVVNESDVPAVSVHVYAPALTEMGRYELRDGVLIQVERERAGVDW